MDLQHGLGGLECEPEKCIERRFHDFVKSFRSALLAETDVMLAMIANIHMLHSLASVIDKEIRFANLESITEELRQSATNVKQSLKDLESAIAKEDVDIPLIVKANGQNHKAN